MDKENVTPTHNEILVSLSKEGNPVICENTNKTGNKPGTEPQIQPQLHIEYIWELRQEESPKCKD